MRHYPYTRLLRRVGLALAGCCIICLLNACLRDEEDNAPMDDAVESERMLGIGTVRTHTSDGSYHFDLDEGHRLMPADTSQVKGYRAIEGQRAIIIFQLLRPATESTDYYGRIHHIENMLTLDAAPLSPQQADTVGNDPISISEAWISAGHLNIRYQVLGDLKQLPTHSLHAVLPLARQESGRPPLIELRHHAHNDSGSDLCGGVASFRLAPLSEWLSSHHTLQLVVKPLFSNNERSYTLSW